MEPFDTIDYLEGFDFTNDGSPSLASIEDSLVYEMEMAPSYPFLLEDKPRDPCIVYDMRGFFTDIQLDTLVDQLSGDIPQLYKNVETVVYVDFKSRTKVSS